MHIISADQFDAAYQKSLIKRAAYFKQHSTTLAGRQKLAKLHTGRQMATLFFQPSTRTRVSFEAAAVKMGIGVVSTENATEHSSSAKGETIEDTFRVLDGYGFDIIVMRHHEAGAAERAASVSQTPVINAGDGTGEHPTQALLDVYTIHESYGRLDGLNIVIGGDLRYGRTVRSLSRLISKHPNNEINFVSVPELQVNKDVKDFLKKAGTKFTETDEVEIALRKADVVYWTRLQKEYIKNPDLFAQKFRLTPALVKKMRPDAIIMHPLPRVDEIDPQIDKDPRAKYFYQTANGLYMRMALIDQILTEKND